MERLRGLEEELDAQVAKVEAEAREQAHLKFEQEKKELMEKMETEMAEMQTRLKLFEKVCSQFAVMICRYTFVTCIIYYRLIPF